MEQGAANYLDKVDLDNFATLKLVSLAWFIDSM